MFMLFGNGEGHGLLNLVIGETTKHLHQALALPLQNYQQTLIARLSLGD